MWPSLATANHIADTANWFFIGSLVVGVVSTILIVWMAGVKEAYWEKDRTESAERIVSLGKETAEANARASEASLALAKLTTPRRLTTAQKASIAERMKAFPNVAFAMSAVGAEPMDFANDIADSLAIAGWRWINWPRGGIVTRPPGGKPAVGLDMLRGIETHISDPNLEPLAIELFHGLTDAGYANQWVLESPPSAIAETAGLASPVIIMIGSKE